MILSEMLPTMVMKVCWRPSAHGMNTACVPNTVHRKLGSSFCLFLKVVIPRQFRPS